MKKYFTYCLFVLVIQNHVTAQNPANTLNLYGQNFPQEKIHIHFDKESYLPGETIWFKAYLFEENLPSERSTNFYASLYDASGRVIQQQLCPIFGASASGHFNIPDSLQGTQVFCRAYTMWMQNFDSSFLFTKAIALINNYTKEDSANVNKTVGLQFFAEGGDMLEGTKNTIAFKANYNNGLPYEINGAIKKQETGEVILPIASTHDGMGRFDIDIEPNQRYYAEWVDDKNQLQQTYLPQAKLTGVALKVAMQKDKIIYNIVNKLPGDSLHILMYMYQKVFYQTSIAVAASLPYTGMVPTNSLPTGVMQLTVFDANWQPVAERVAFVNNDDYSMNATITNKETSTQKRAKNILEIAVADTIPANMSLSITDADINTQAANSTIVTDFLLSADIKGYIHNARYYFSDDKAAKANLDLVMLTHGWRRYNWDAIKNNKMPSLKYAADNYLSAYGQISKEVMPKLDSNEMVNLIVKTRDSTKNFYFVKPNATGLIQQAGLIFYDTASVLYSFNKNKLLNPQMAFSASNYTYPQPPRLTGYSNYKIPDTAGIPFNPAVSTYAYYLKNDQLFNKDKTLQTVIVKTNRLKNWKNDPMFKMDEKYTDGVFRGGGWVDAFDVMHDDMAAAKQDVFNYLRNKSTLIKVSYEGGRKVFTSGSGTPFVFVNEQMVDLDYIDNISIDDIAYIKIIFNYVVGRNKEGLFGPAISIYLKKGDDLIDRRPKDTDLKVVKIAGYSPIKEFYSPSYTEKENTLGTDARTTLLWMPYVLTDKNNLKIPVTFFNNDFTKRLKVVLEGINDEGKMIHIEKIIE